MSHLVTVITSPDPAIRIQSLSHYCHHSNLQTLLDECAALETFRHQSDNLYERVRALFFLYAIHRFHLPTKAGFAEWGEIPFDGYEQLLKRRFEEALNHFLASQAADGPNKSISSALAEAYRQLGFQTLADQVRSSVRTVRGNQWMFRIGHPADQPLRVHPALLQLSDGMFPVLREETPVRMDLTHSGWSDIFFLGMDFPEGARVLNVSIDLAVDGRDEQPTPPIESYFRLIDEPVIRLVSVDLNATAVLHTIDALFDFAADYLGLLKAAIISAGLLPPGMEGANQPLSVLLNKLVGDGRGFELVSKVNDIPKGSRLAVSTNLLASLITVCMRATGQTASLTEKLTEDERRLVAARAILGEWLAGSGGGWQDSGGVWPGIKMIHGEEATAVDPEWQISRGRLLPSHHILGQDAVSPETRQALQESLVLVHGGMAQDVGPILEMVTERYLLRSEEAWHGRQQAITLYDKIVSLLKAGDIQALAKATHQNFHEPIQTIIPWAGNMYTDRIIADVQSHFGDDFWGFWMLGGMAGGGMGFMFDPARTTEARRVLQKIMLANKERLETAVPFAMNPVVYSFGINERGTWASLHQGKAALMPANYYALTVPALLRQPSHTLSPRQQAELIHFGEACRTQPALSGMVQALFDQLLPSTVADGGNAQTLQALLAENGFDPIQHEQIRADLQNGRIGLAQNRLPVSTTIEDVPADSLFDGTTAVSQALIDHGEAALAAGEVAVVSLAGGAGSRWTQGAGVVKALNPFVKMDGRYRSFVELHLAKSRQINQRFSMKLPHIFTTSYLTHTPIADTLRREDDFGYEGPLRLSRGRSVGLRLVPMARDLRFAWEEQPQQLLDEQAQKVQESLHAALIGWAKSVGEGSDYTDNVPLQCLHPVGHWYEVPNMLLNGTLAALLAERPSLKTLMIHNIDTVGAHVDPGLLGVHLHGASAITTEVVTRQIEDRGGGLARINGRLQLIEGLALPDESIEFSLSTYNSSTSWVDIDQLLALFGLRRQELGEQALVETAVRRLAARMPTYITLKEVKKRWGNGQEDIFPVTQFEKLWGDMTMLPELPCRFVLVSRQRGQQIKEVAQLDGWLRDGSAAYVQSLCEFS